MKVSDLTGAELDYWIGKVEHIHVWIVDKPTPKSKKKECRKDLTYQNGWTTYSPSTNWSQGGPIIEKYEIQLNFWNKNNEKWEAIIYKDDTDPSEYFGYGDTILTAAMRAIVTSVYGDTVDD